MRSSSIAAIAISVLACCTCLEGRQPASRPATGGEAQPVSIGVGRVDITPDHPVRLAGYAARKTESEGVAQPLWAKALAIGDDRTGPAVLVTVDSIGVPAWIVERVAGQLQARARIPRERLVVCSTHTHEGPRLSRALKLMFGQAIPPEHEAHIDAYTEQLVGKIEQVALAALADRRPGRLAWAQGRVGFAVNRRVFKDGKYAGFGVNRDGPVDHAMPALIASDLDGGLRAVVANYACHCTTLGSDFNQVCGDWAGYAQEYVERGHPGAACLVTIGCGADANPEPRTGLELARQHGRAVADEIGRLLKGSVKPLDGPPACRFERVRLPFGRIPTREEWETRAKAGGAAAYHASCQLSKLESGLEIPKEFDYPVQSWVFGDRLALVFLGGEVVVDYTLALKKEFDAGRLWVTAYANDVPCYIASKRILTEGGYEADESMIYYDKPARLAPAAEDLILSTVRRLMPGGFTSSGSNAGG